MIRNQGNHEGYPDAKSQPASREVTAEPIPDTPGAIAEVDIGSRLRQADTHYYVLMRHAIAPGTGDPAGFQLEDCSTQRNLSAAGLMGLGPVERLPALNSFFRDAAQEPGRTRQLRQFMVDYRDEPGVTVLVTHFVNIGAIVGGGVASGEMVVLRVDERDELDVVDYIEPL